MVDKVSGTISLLRGGNYDMIRSLLDESYLTHNILMTAINDSKYCPACKEDIVAMMDLTNAYGALDAVRDKKFIQRMIENVVVVCSPDDVQMNDIFMSLTDAGGVLVELFYLFRTSDDAFEHYVTSLDIIDNVYLVQCTMTSNRPNANIRMRNWIWSRWISQPNTHDFIDSCKTVEHASYDSNERFWEAFNHVATQENIDRLRLYFVYRCLKPEYLMEILIGSEYYEDFVMLCVVENVIRKRTYGIRTDSTHLAYDPIMFESFMKDNNNATNIYTTLCTLWFGDDICSVFCEIMNNALSMRLLYENYLNSQ